MNVLVVYSHPNPESFNHAILEAVLKGLSGAGHENDVFDLYDMDFDPCLKVDDFVKVHLGSNSEDVLLHQARVSNADVLVFIHPNWWGGMPAILKGWIDRVFSMGFAYKADEETSEMIGLLNIQKALVLTTCGSPEIYSLCIDAYKEIWDQKILQFCGIQDVQFKLFYDVISVDDKTRNGYLDEARNLGMNI